MFDWQESRVAPIREEKFWNADFESFEEILEEFLQPPAAPDEGDGEEAEDTGDDKDAVEISPTMPLRAACFGVAGPVVDNRCRATNLPWTIDGHALTETLNTSSVRILNDVEAMAYGVLVLEPEETEVVHGEPQEDGTKVLNRAGHRPGRGRAVLGRGAVSRVAVRRRARQLRPEQ